MSRSGWALLALLTLTACETLTGARVGPQYDRSDIPASLDYPPDLIGLVEPDADGQDGATITTRLDASVLWPLVRQVLADEGLAVAQWSPEKQTLRTGWRRYRTGRIASDRLAQLGQRERFEITLSEEGKDKRVLSLTQQRQLDNPQSSLGWQDAAPEPRRQAELAGRIRAQIQSGLRPASAVSVERFRDEQGLYLVLSLPAPQALARVDRALRFMDYNLMENEDSSGEWFVTPRPKPLPTGEKAPDPRDPASGSRPLRLHLFADRQSNGTVLELVPEDEFHVGIRDEIERVTRRLAEQLEKSEGQL